MRKDYKPPDQVRIAGSFPRPQSRKKIQRLGASLLILSVVTDFIWLTFTDVLAMTEQLNDDITEESVRVALWMLVKSGKLERRRYRGERLNGYQVKKPVTGQGVALAQGAPDGEVIHTAFEGVGHAQPCPT
jgi:hypothetical protein